MTNTERLAACLDSWLKIKTDRITNGQRKLVETTIADLRWRLTQA